MRGNLLLDSGRVFYKPGLLHGPLLPVYGFGGLLGVITVHVAQLFFNVVLAAFSMDALYVLAAITGIILIISHTATLKSMAGFDAYLGSLIIFMAYNIAISSMAVKRMSERKQGIQAINVVWRFFDKQYLDSFLKKIYPNTIYVGSM